jgi:DHA1 family tetracycline resistance protein-like MFS transporter
MTTDPRPSSEPRRAAIAFIFITVMLDMLALGMIIPVLPLLIEDFRGGDTAAAARTVGVFAMSWATIQLFAAPLLGSLSDRFGRRPIVLLSNLGLGLDYVLMALAPTLGWLFAGRLLSGFTSASVPTAYAYIADVTPPDKRARGYGLLGAAFGIGFVLGPALGGYLATYGPRTPFWVAAGLSLANAAYGFFVLPESLAADHRSAFSWKRANPLGAVDLLRKQAGLTGFAVMHFLYCLAHQSLQSMFVLNVAYRYNWTSSMVGGALAMVGICFAIVQAGLVAPVVKRFGERRALMAGLAFGAVGFMVYGLAPTGSWFLVGIPIMSLWGLYGPAAQGIATRRVGRAHQGALQGALASIQMTTGIVGPMLFAEVFARSIDQTRGWNSPGVPYVLSAVMLVVALALAIKVAHTPNPAASQPQPA